ncbi:hypothetical protein LC593_33990 [Nostoc sp. CHAB 5844]|nr:hypothetical protein [Nostoc sp. CHAB 5844]
MWFKENYEEHSHPSLTGKAFRTDAVGRKIKGLGKVQGCRGVGVQNPYTPTPSFNRQPLCVSHSFFIYNIYRENSEGVDIKIYRQNSEIKP